MQEEAARIAAQVAGMSGAGSEDVLEAKRLVAQKSAELDAAHTCVESAAASCCCFLLLVLPYTMTTLCSLRCH